MDIRSSFAEARCAAGALLPTNGVRVHHGGTKRMDAHHNPSGITLATVVRLAMGLSVLFVGALPALMH